MGGTGVCTWICIADGNDTLDRLSNRWYGTQQPLRHAHEFNCLLLLPFIALYMPASFEKTKPT